MNTGYKYWVAFEVRCIDTDNRMFQTHSIFLNKPIENEEDLTIIQDAFATKLQEHATTRGVFSNFKITLTSWPHLLGIKEIPANLPTETIPSPEPERVTIPFLKLVVDNKDLDNITGAEK